ncbi:DUF2750 domain-containing protein [Photobacterium alginatilyticum]|uniref:DUF2750 domain-containing protein n=1 Tax=Photobacterium alginatilyticum TaxID=1775171 RepID=A0ABW9YK25_9GAMM|nr:DUF2750 domain-containing protein [Photobacterium alginatilyticum]NBI54105.1 DUF2750 domain-containing protein [Photobacterium alginatilyticum]
MSNPLDSSQITAIQAYDAEKRYKYLVKEVVSNRQIWILTDEHGCVMLNTDDEDCVPVWPNKEFAESWATGEWESCKAEAISLNKWHSRWTHGLEDDELAVVIFPNQDEDGLVVYPDELDYELKQQERKHNQR